MERIVPIRTEFITLGQLLKLIDMVGSGSEVKILLGQGRFRVNGEFEDRRGRKLRPGDFVTLPNRDVVRIGDGASPG